MDFEQLFLNLQKEASSLKKENTLHLLSQFSATKHELGHSNVIAALISPKYLPNWELTSKSFLVMLGNAINRELSNETIQEVIREKYANGRFIDLYIKTNNYQIIIENKIDADDQDKQIQDYIEYAEKTAKPRTVLTFYLTLDGKSPSAKSISAKDYQLLKSQDKLSELSYGNDIIPWLEDIACEDDTVSSEIKTYLIALKELCNMSNDNIINFCKEKFQFVTDHSTTEELYTIANGLHLIALTKHRLSILQKVLESLNSDIRDNDYNDMSVHYISHNDTYFDDFDNFARDILNTYEYYGVILNKGDNVKILIEFPGINDKEKCTFGFAKCISSSKHHIEHLKQGLSIDSWQGEKGCRLYKKENDIWGPSVSIGWIQEKIQTQTEESVASMITNWFWDILKQNNLM